MERAVRQRRLISTDANLCVPTLRSFLKLAECWGLNEDEQIKLLGAASAATLHRLRHSDVSAVSSETMERLSYILGIFKAINILVPDPKRADKWMRMPNKAPLFGSRSALDLMTSGNVDDLHAVRQYLDAQLV